MPTQNLECQIAQSQIKRYLAGELLSGETFRQLEAHVGECRDCQALIAQRRQMLQSMLASEPAPKAVVSAPAPTAPALTNPATATRTTQPSKASLVKTGILSVALAACLLGMSYVSRNPTTLLGEKVATTKVEAAAPAPKLPRMMPALGPHRDRRGSEPLPMVSKAPPVVTPTPVAPAPVATPKLQPRRAGPRVTVRERARRTVRRSTPRRTPAAAPARPRNSIRVYPPEAN